MCSFTSTKRGGGGGKSFSHVEGGWGSQGLGKGHRMRKSRIKTESRTLI